jgi:phospholipid-transporting ATPase
MYRRPTLRIAPHPIPTQPTNEQSAHIGVGVCGLEGQQAVNSSDYAIGQFRFLGNLLLEHGRFNYRRTSTVIKYIFYKNALLVLPQFFFGLYSSFSGQNFYNDVYYQVSGWG